jgi:ketosteroid isomerase-like protein
MKERFALRRVGVIALLFFVVHGLGAQTRPNDDEATAVSGFLAEFLSAFNNLEWDKFRNSFTDDATVFYPRGIANRASGRAEIEAHFRLIFEQIRAGRSKGPFMDLQPRGLLLQIQGETAIVTFHLDDRPGFVNRRTLVLRKVGGAWKITHLHASEVAVEPGTAVH